VKSEFKTINFTGTADCKYLYFLAAIIFNFRLFFATMNLCRNLWRLCRRQPAAQPQFDGNNFRARFNRNRHFVDIPVDATPAPEAAAKANPRAVGVHAGRDNVTNMNYRDQIQIEAVSSSAASSRTKGGKFKIKILFPK